MLFKKQIISAMAGVAMLALPVSSFAANHNYRHNQSRAFANSQAFVSHSVPTVAPRYASTYNYNHAYNYNHGNWTPPASWTSTPNQAWHPNSWNNGWVPPAQWHHHRWNPYAWNNGYMAPPAYRPYAAPVYGPPVYPYPSPSYSGYGFPGYSGNSGYGLSGYPGNANNLNWLLQKRYNTMENIARLRAKGDSKGAARLVPVVTALNQRINSMR